MLPRHAADAGALLRVCAEAVQTVIPPSTRMRQHFELSQLCCGALLPGPCGVAVWSILLWSAVSCPYPMLREAHRSQFDPALEVAGSGLGERPSSPFRVQKRKSSMRHVRNVPEADVSALANVR